jgi:hypothetical protein
MVLDSNLRKDVIDGIEYASTQDLGIGHTIVGENGAFPPVGYVLDVFPN